MADVALHRDRLQVLEDLQLRSKQLQSERFHFEEHLELDLACTEITEGRDVEDSWCCVGRFNQLAGCWLAGKQMHIDVSNRWTEACELHIDDLDRGKLLA